ncbi:MAG: universal stress protein [Desulfococcaceae bacterium]
MKKTILIALKDSKSSGAITDYLTEIPFQRKNLEISLLHVFRKPGSSEELMGADFVKEEPLRLQAVLEDAKEKLVRAGFPADQIRIELLSESSPTIADGIISHCNQGNFDMVMIGRRKKSRSEEFVMGDVSVKLVRNLGKTAVLVVKSQ